MEMIPHRSARMLFQLVLIILFAAQASGMGETSKEHDLVNDLFVNYNNIVRPVLDPSQSVLVKVSYYLISLGEVDERAQSVGLHGFLQLTWRDEFLKWDPKDYADIESIFMPVDRVWIPDIMFENSIGDQFYNKAHYFPRIYSTGFVQWEVGGVIKIICDFLVHNYPFDDQECHMEVVTWAGTDDHLKLYGDYFDAKTYYVEHSDWKVYDTRVVNHSFIEKDDAYSEVHLYFVIERKVLADMLSTVLPVLLISLLNGLVFLLPAASGEKVSMALTLLLTFIVMQYTLDETIPSQSDSTPLLDIYVTMFMIYSGVTVLLAVVSMRLYHRPDHVSDMGKKFLRLYNKVNERACCGLRNKVSAVKDIPDTEFTWAVVSYAFDRVCLILFGVLFILATTVTLIKIVNVA